MQSSKTNDETSQKTLIRHIVFNVEEAVFSKQITKRLNQLKHQVKIDGFRSGKIPMSVLKRRYEADVKNELLKTIAEENFEQLIKQQTIEPANIISFFIPQDTKDSPVKPIPGMVQVGIWFEITPKLELVDFSDFTIIKPNYTLSDTDTNQFLCQWYRSNFADWELADNDYEADFHNKVSHQLTQIDIIEPTEDQVLAERINQKLPPLNESYTLELKETASANIQTLLKGAKVGDIRSAILTLEDLDISTVHIDEDIANIKIQVTAQIDRIFICKKSHKTTDPKEIFGEETEIYINTMKKLMHSLLQSIIWSFVQEQINAQVQLIYDVDPPMNMLLSFYQENLNNLTNSNDQEKSQLFSTVKNDLKQALNISNLLRCNQLNKTVTQYHEKIKHYMQSQSDDTKKNMQKKYHSLDNWFSNLSLLYSEAILAKKIFETAHIIEYNCSPEAVLAEKANQVGFKNYSSEDISTAFNDVFNLTESSKPDNLIPESTIMNTDVNVNS
ncbi:MAG: trigger factor family protein [Endozoicomonadaceae bacterium]|nr:trigger factor family protein [Endozoicomonadaceae bacterium]